MTQHAVIAGGGLAGMAAAMALIEAGWKVTMCESRRRLGGRASSFHDRQSGETLDNCQHVLLGCCTNLLDFYTKLGVSDEIEWYDTTWWARGQGQQDAMRSGRMPAPLHQCWSFLRMKGLPWRSRANIGYAARRMLRMGTQGRRDWQHHTGAALLQHLKQDQTAITQFWDPIIVSALNMALDDVSASHVLHVMQEGFMAGRTHAMMGVPRIPLDTLYSRFLETIDQSQQAVQFGTKVTGLGIEHGRVIGLETNQQFIRADATVLALPWEKVSAIATERQRQADRRLQHLDKLGHSPILGVHLFLDRPVMQHPHLVLPGRSTHWLFHKGTDTNGHQHLHAVVSAADDWMDCDEDTIANRVMDDVIWACPEARSATLLSVRPIKERRATFRATPDAEEVRPQSAPNQIGHEGGDLEGLYLAGDYCCTGWPATMEGAVRSGYLAAEAITNTPRVVDDLPSGWLVNTLMRH